MSRPDYYLGVLAGAVATTFVLTIGYLVSTEVSRNACAAAHGATHCIRVWEPSQ